MISLKAVWKYTYLLCRKILEVHEGVGSHEDHIVFLFLCFGFDECEIETLVCDWAALIKEFLPNLSLAT